MDTRRVKKKSVAAVVAAVYENNGAIFTMRLNCEDKPITDICEDYARAVFIIKGATKYIFGDQSAIVITPDKRWRVALNPKPDCIKEV